MSLYFAMDRTQDGKPIKILTLIDEYSRHCLALEVDGSIKSDDVLHSLSNQFLIYGIPENIRSDNGPEFTAKAVRGWLERIGVKTAFIEPGSPWENGYIESFNGKPFEVRAPDMPGPAHQSFSYNYLP